MIELSEQQIIDELAQRLADAHATVEPGRVAAVVHEQYARFEGRPIRTSSRCSSNATPRRN
ncbi:three-helix bundle dimerization domain-containing protein [Mycolicibacterium psychrotolerans]|uniref:three-helix bundle dimerization domain-containing protein n=1 Tax=Mycolicibacterium psychrotolerans TaxID=216929 RepID=UPI001FE76C2F|nr:hypothetical protein [Mycolicibacterium psychrotolerans]